MHSKKVKKVLEQGGWYEGRSIDISQQLFFLNDLGFQVFDKAIEFFKEYDQLKIPRIYSQSYTGGTNINDFDHFNVLKMVQYIYTSKGEERKIRVKNKSRIKRCYEKVLPIGSLHNLDIPIYITESGKIVAEVMGKTVIYGNSIKEGVENIILGKSVGTFPEPYKPPKLREWKKKRLNELMNPIITNLTYKNNAVFWTYNSILYSIEVSNFIRTMKYVQSLVLIITKKDSNYLYSFYSADAKPIFSYISNDRERTKARGTVIYSHFNKIDNIIIKTNNNTIKVPDLNFLAYDKRQDKLVVMIGKSPEQNRLFIYDLCGNLIKELKSPDGSYYTYAEIDNLGYITVYCKNENETVRYEFVDMGLDSSIYNLLKTYDGI